MRNDWPAGPLWRLVLVAAVTFVVLDFVHYPASPDPRAAPPSRDLTLLLTASDASSPLAAEARVLAGALSEPPHSARALSSTEGTAHTIVDFARNDETDGRQLLLLTANGLAELERGVHQPTTADERQFARAALAALTRLRPVAPAFVDLPTLLVRCDDGPPTLAALARTLQNDPRARVAGIPADAASKAALAGLVDSLGLVGDVPYRIFPSGADAALALSGGGVGLVLAPRSQTLAERHRGTVRALPLGRSAATPALSASLTPLWAVLVAPPAISDRARSALARRTAQALARPSWRRNAKRRGLRRLRIGPGGPGHFIERARAQAERLAELAARVPERRRASF